MIYTISADILKETDCQNDFSCLTTGKCGDREMCEVDYLNGPNVSFLKTKEYANCIHRLNYGGMQMCNCPTRYAIHKKYSRLTE